MLDYKAGDFILEMMQKSVLFHESVPSIWLLCYNPKPKRGFGSEPFLRSCQVPVLFPTKCSMQCAHWGVPSDSLWAVQRDWKKKRGMLSWGVPVIGLGIETPQSHEVKIKSNISSQVVSAGSLHSCLMQSAECLLQYLSCQSVRIVESDSSMKSCSLNIKSSIQKQRNSWFDFLLGFPWPVAEWLVVVLLVVFLCVWEECALGSGKGGLSSFKSHK